MPWRFVSLTSLALTAIAAGPMRAQVVGTLGAGTGHVTYDDAARATVVSLTPAVMFEGEQTTLSATGSFTRFAGGLWSAHAVAAGSRFSKPRGPFRSELSAQLETNSHRGALRTAFLLAQGRGHLIDDGHRGLWLGGGAGHVWRSPSGASVLRADFGAWTQLRDATIRLTAAHNVVSISTRSRSAQSEFALAALTPRNETVSRSTIRYLDTEAYVAWSRGRVAFDGAAARRTSPDGLRANTWLLGGSLELTDRLALVGAAGANAVDLAQGLPGGRYATIALRVTTRAGDALEMRSRSRASAHALNTWREADGTVLLVVHAPRARRVELMGDFTDWRPMVLERGADDHFAVRIRLPAGSYRINVRVDGGMWTAPPGTTPVADEYNGAAGLLVIGG
ncbi:MAG: glycogen-binding domain-containing protein [Gemmatimonadaceae bacterium]